MFKIHPQLLKDTHYLFKIKEIHVLLHKNASIPWIILVPETDVVEIFDLSTQMQKSINSMYKDIAVYFKQNFSTEKMNIAAIGNIVPQLHIHLIGRKPDDACWPNVVWGNDYTYIKYTPKQITDIKEALLK